ncbi:MAG: hypothetical protein HYV63_04400 [Candidatus Schekmanbacteria bacterium]|nr:hypothetical protein [Candidatus Schekmanbacteria bacterium]
MSGNYQLARREFRDAAARLAAGDGGSEALLRAAKALNRLGKPDMALYYLKAAMRRAPGEPEPLNQLAACYLKLGRNVDALAATGKVIRLGAASAATYELAAAAAVATNSHAVARAFLEDGIVEFPTAIRLRSLLGSLLYDHHIADYHGAKDALTAVVQLRPGDPQALFLLTMICANLGQFAEAMHFGKLYLGVDPRSAPVCYLMSRLARKLDQMDTALHYAGTAARLRPADPAYRNNLERLGAAAGQSV